ncbi:P-loop containing nucleoside triphosphate hydrolase protein [Aaosphaeria arxii CBS 175.79]|uniref:P-loop containing nucleoside triphosphate hydrolase protein n=1 Tax=Aaosphaeria arxii CBS 175.79 TaxID=1450172 RepID=A0A6A5Y534_9PLEO|nr:P-loop containing nucleoside triphosphate hydrolase protein [Aaosphaeria arxii CBS 175.79]KAF2020323.1 P-loop containing nucleoside triphosphate hydrolase protein [Aaosphaeria arxii CBS 175.79]
MASSLLWGALDLDLLDTSEPAWPKYHRSWILSCLFEAILCILESVLFFQSEKSRHGIALFALQVCKIKCSIALGLNANVICRPTKTRNDAENQWLLECEPTERAVYGSTPSCQNDTENGDALIKMHQRKRLEKQGWFAYIKEFRIFLPCLWPTGSIRGKLCLVVLILDLVINRFLRVLTPRQLGVITDKLIAHDFDMACYEVGIWVLFSWLKNTAGPLGVIKSMALLEVRNFSYQEICRLAFKHVMTLSMDFHSNKDSAEIIKAVEQGKSIGDLAKLLLLDIPPVVVDLVVAICYITSLFDGYVAFTTFLVGISYVCITIKIKNWTQPLRRIYKERSRTESNVVNESLGGWQTVTYFNRLAYEEQRYMGAVQDSLVAKQAYRNRMNSGNAVETMIMFLGLLSASLLAIRKISSGEASAGDFVTLGTFWTTMTYPLEMIAWSHSNMTSIFIDAERLLQLILMKPSISDRPDSYKLGSYAGKVEFRNVEFSYGPTGKKILNGINFGASPGEMVAFVGKTGSGKSTILKLLCRHYDVTGGSIFINNQDVRNISLQSLRNVVGVVPQNPSLFNRTILENVRYSEPDATDEEAFDACKSAALHEDIMSHPDHYNTKVGERGVKLSGGELQRLAIAQLLLKKKSKIILLDEATSAMDSSTEAEVQEAFQKLRSGRTLFVVAHRLSTIVDADLILFVKDGDIVERGTHQELIERKGEYFELWERQNRQTGKK